ncbi:MAG: ABC transporter permease [Coriobacteriales bacterium]|jgi:putative ABC transport system permease protein|nr:ABC transporter permease [Coriobacteriales bacterium]
MRYLVLQSLRTRRIQTIAVVLTIAVSIAAFVALFLLYGGMQRGIALAEERRGAEVAVVPWEASEYLDDADVLFAGAPAPIYLDAEIAEKVAAIDGVGRTTVQFYGQSLAEGCCSTGSEVRVIGVDATSDWLIGSYTDYDLTHGLADDEVVIGRNVLGFESGSGSLLGARIRVVAELEPSGTELDNAILMDIDRLRELVAATPQLQHFWDRYGDPRGLVSAILLDYEPGYEPYLTKNKIEGQGVKVIERSKVVEDITKQLSVVFALMFAAGIVLTVASLLQFVARFYSLVWERKAELALYRALGATRRGLRAVIGGEAFVLTALGAVAGIVGGIALYRILYFRLQDASAFPFAAFPTWAAVAGIVAITLVFLAFAAASVVVPLRQVNRIDPALALKQVDIG